MKTKKQDRCWRGITWVSFTRWYWKLLPCSEAFSEVPPGLLLVIASPSPGSELNSPRRVSTFSTLGIILRAFFYNWNELTYSPVEWMRAGLVSQRTRAYHTVLNVQRGLLLGFSHNRFDFTTYVFNAGWTDPTVVFSLAVKF
jgi:hypothetical protein